MCKNSVKLLRLTGSLRIGLCRVKEGSALLAVDPTPNVAPEVVNLIYARAKKAYAI